MDYNMKPNEIIVDSTDLIPKSAEWTIKRKNNGYLASRGDLYVYYDNVTFDIEHFGINYDSDFSFMIGDVKEVLFCKEYLHLKTMSGINIIVPTGKPKND